MLRCLSGGCSSRVQHWPAQCVPGAVSASFAPDALYSPKSAEQGEDSSLFPQRVFHFGVPAPFSPQPVSAVPCYFRDGQGAVQSPISSLGAREGLGFPTLPTHKHLPGSSEEALLRFRSSTSPKSTPHETKDLTCF